MPTAARLRKGASSVTAAGDPAAASVLGWLDYIPAMARRFLAGFRSGPAWLTWLFASGTLVGGVGSYVPVVLANKAIGLLRVYIIIWLFRNEPGEYGLQYLGLQLINVLMAIVTLGIPETIMRFAPAAAAAGELRRFLIRSVGWGTAISAGGCLTLLALAPGLATPLYQTLPIAGVPPLPGQALVGLTQLTIVCTFAHILFLLLLAILKGLASIRAVILLETLHTLAFSVLSIGMVLATGPTAFAVLEAYTAALLLSCGIVATLLVWHLATTYEVPEPKPRSAYRLLDFAGPLALAGVVWQILIIYPDWYVLKRLGNDALGDFGAFRQFAQLVTVIAIAVNTVLIGRVLRLWETAGPPPARQLWATVYKATMLTLGCGSGLLVAAGGVLVDFFPPAYHDGLAAWGVSLFAFLMQGHISFVSVRFALIRQTKLLLPAYAVAAAVVVLSCAPWAAAAGLFGAAAAGGLALFVGLLVGIVLLGRWGEPTDARTLLAIAASAVCLLPPLLAGVASLAFAVAAVSSRWLFADGELAELRSAARRMIGQLTRHSDRIDNQPPTSGHA